MESLYHGARLEGLSRGSSSSDPQEKDRGGQVSFRDSAAAAVRLWFLDGWSSDGRWAVSLLLGNRYRAELELIIDQI